MLQTKQYFFKILKEMKKTSSLIPGQYDFIEDVIEHKPFSYAEMGEYMTTKGTRLKRWQAMDALRQYLSRIIQIVEDTKGGDKK